MCNSENLPGKIKEVINNLRDRGYFAIMESHPEDFVEGRTDWEELADNYKTLYYALIEIENDILNISQN